MVGGGRGGRAEVEEPIGVGGGAREARAGASWTGAGGRGEWGACGRGEGGGEWQMKVTGGTSVQSVTENEGKAGAVARASGIGRAEGGGAEAGTRAVGVQGSWNQEGSKGGAGWEGDW